MIKLLADDMAGLHMTPNWPTRKSGQLWHNWLLYGKPLHHPVACIISSAVPALKGDAERQSAAQSSGPMGRFAEPGTESAANCVWPLEVAACKIGKNAW